MNAKNQSILDTAVGFQSQSLNLQGIVSSPLQSQGRLPALLICHPHPMFGGDMDNPVVRAICLEACSNQFVCLRFNFRGAGASEGMFDHGIGEQHDLQSALELLKNWPAVDRKKVGVVGYSFGANVILDSYKNCKSVQAFAFVAPSVSSVKNRSIAKDKRPSLFISGQQDKISPPTILKQELNSISPGTKIFEIHNADHGLAGAESIVAKKVVGFLKDTIIKQGAQ